jgi:hypothetical protein
MATRMQQRRGTEAQWTSANPVLAAGEIGFETDTNQFKIGDGVNVWADLSYFQTIDTLGGSLDDYVPLTEKGAANGVATLDGLGQVPVSQLQNLIDTAPGTLDTLNEIADALLVVDGQVSGVQQNLDAAIAQEVTDRDFAISGAIASEVTDRNAAIASAIGDEVTARDAAISQAITDEVTQRDAAITTAIAAEVSDRNDAITAAIGQEAADRDAAIASEIATAIAPLATDVNAQTYADTAEVDAKAYTDSELSGHNSDTTNVHGIADTSLLATSTDITNAVTAHNDDTTGVHGIADTSVLATQTDIQGAKDYADDQIDVHVAITTNVHGIADTADLVLKSANTQTLSGDLVISGNLEVAGTTTTVSASDLVVSDPLIYIGEGNTGNLVDLGLVSSYNDGTYQHAGIVRDSSANKWKVFKGVTDEPTTTVNFAQGSLDDLAVNNVEVAGVVFSDGTQSKQGVPSLTPIIAKTDSYTLSALTERDSLVEINKATATTLTIPADASVNYPVGTSIDILQVGAGQVTIAGAGGVTVNATPGLKLRTQWSSATLFKRAANTWVVYGDLSA